MDSFYRAFEDRYRGSRELIRERLQVYVPFICPLVAQRPDAIALDLGCGRGEWLDLVSSEGFHALGVDLDAGMLAACRERGMDVEQRDALEKLRSLPDASISVVSAFHVVEHIDFDDVRHLIAEALRVLVPGGLLIMETPNPENIVVAGSRFYMDPSHLKPLPPPLLSFAAEYAGFERVKVVRLQESRSLHNPAASITLLNVLEEVSPDYAVVAQKGGDEAALAGTATAFEPEYGLTLPALAIRHAERAEARLLQLEASVKGAEGHLQQLDASMSDAAGRLEQFEAGMNDVAEHFVQFEAGIRDAGDRATLAEARAVEAQREAREIQTAVREAIGGALMHVGSERTAELERRVQRAELLAHQYFTQLEAVYASTSWRVTAPLRGIRLFGRTLFRNPLKSNAKQVIRHAARYAHRRPWLAMLALRTLKRFPRLKLRLAHIVSGLEVRPIQSTVAMPTDAAHLTPQAQEIYRNLKIAAARRQKTEG